MNVGHTACATTTLGLEKDKENEENEEEADLYIDKYDVQVVRAGGWMAQCLFIVC